MKTIAIWIAVAAGAMAACSSRGPAQATPAAAATTQYRCPMHPQVVQDHPGDCPICNMKLVAAAPKTAPAGTERAAHVEGAPLPRAATTASSRGISVAADKQKVVGMTVTGVQEGGGSRTLRLLGRVAPDDKRLFKVNAGVEGSIRDLGSASAGTFVKKDQVLGTYFAPNSYATIQLFILNLSGKEYAAMRRSEGAVEGEGPASAAYANLQQRMMQLENFGVSALQRDEIARTRKIPDTVWIVAPSDGYVLARNATVGMKFARGEELFRIADLRRVWVLADVFLTDARHVRTGMKATVSVPEQGITLPATVVEILPQFDAAARTLKVRLEVDNPRTVLRPDMFVDVGLTVKLPAGVVIPVDAIIDSGLAKTVFVESGAGVFEPRRVETGWRSGDQVEVVKGLSPGERIVTSGTFFLDSESRLRPTPSGAAVADRTEPDPTGHEHRADGGAGLPSGAPASGGRVKRLHAGDAP